MTQEEDNIQKDFRRISAEMTESDPKMCRALIVIKTYSQMIREKVDGLVSNGQKDDK